MPTRPALVIALSLLLLTRAGPASADAPEIEIARGHSRRATDHYQASRFREAAAEFELARKELPLPEIDYNLGRCYESLGDVDSALTAYRRFLVSAPTSSARDDVEARIRLLELASPKVHERRVLEGRRERARRHWRLLYPPAIALGVLAIASGAASAGLYPSLLHERDLLAAACPPDCTGSYPRAHTLKLATLATFGIAIGAVGVDLALWGVAGAEWRRAP